MYVYKKNKISENSHRDDLKLNDGKMVPFLILKSFALMKWLVMQKDRPELETKQKTFLINFSQNEYLCQQKKKLLESLKLQWKLSLETTPLFLEYLCNKILYSYIHLFKIYDTLKCCSPISYGETRNFTSMKTRSSADISGFNWTKTYNSNLDL